MVHEEEDCDIAWCTIPKKMSDSRSSSVSARPVNIRNASPSPGSLRPASPDSSSHVRHASIARLASPVPSSSGINTPATRQIPTPAQVENKDSELAARSSHASPPGPGHSALAAALAKSQEDGSRHRSPSPRAASPTTAGHFLQERVPRSNYGSIDNRSFAGSQPKFEDPDVVKRHLVQPSRSFQAATNEPEEEFSSLQLQGGDIHRQVYKWSEEAEGSNGKGKISRSKSVDISRPEPEEEVLDINTIKVPGGFRRNFLRRAVDTPESSGQSPNRIPPPSNLQLPSQAKQPKMHTSNFLEFLTLYGHFAGEELEDEDENEPPESDDYFGSEYYRDDGSDHEPGEGSALLTPRTPGGKRRKKERERHANVSPSGALLLLLKSFVGTGVLFLPKAFLNGGILFSSIVLVGVAALSYYCFILLVNTRLKIGEGSFGDIGGVLYGKWLRALILSSIVLSQLGFVSAYIVFTSENLQAFILAVSKCKTWIDIKFMVLMQLIIFLPLSLIRDIGKLGFTALIADAFIMLGLVYLYFYDISTIAYEGISDIASFNPATWTLFIGTAIFTFEGVGLIIPIQESMKRPEQFPPVLALVMVIITIIFTSAGALSYAAYGSATKTVILLNLPQDDKFVNAVQFLYSLAILLSTPLQLFPAIRILEMEIFPSNKSGKFDRLIKWKKNVFRFLLVMVCALVAWVGANDLDKFVALVGSFACVPLVYVYPPLLHVKAVAASHRQRIIDLALCGVGLVGCAYTTVLTVSSWIGGEEVKAPGYCDN
ncbi:MAG: hypothetical protein Q9227_003234 [Pyrenula ochraceoflavens]